MLTMRFDEIWKRILEHQGEEFHTYRGYAFKYVVDGNQVVPDRTKFPLHKNNFMKATDVETLSRVSDLPRNVMGPSYVFAIMTDSRIRKS